MGGGKLFHALVQQAPEVILVCEVDGRIRYASPTLARMLGHDPGAIVGLPVSALVDHQDHEALAEALRGWARQAGVGPPVGLRWLHAQGQHVRGETIGTNLLGDPSVRGLVLDTRQVPETGEDEEENGHPFHDPLTGLASKRLFDHRVSAAQAQRRRDGSEYAVVSLDLEGAQALTESLGPAAAEAVLAQAGARLLAATRAHECAARLADDRFGVLVTGADPLADAAATAARMAAAFRDPFSVDGQDVVVDAAVGIVTPLRERDGGRSHGEAPAVAFPDAPPESARAGADRGITTRARLPEAAMRSLMLEADLRLAVARGQLRVHYQPVIRLSSGGIIGFEALVRWRHPRFGLVEPAEFVPQSERSGLIVEIGRSVLRTACGDLRRWRSLPNAAHLLVAVNLSGRQLQDPGLIATVTASLEEAGLEPEALVLEVTETVFVADASGGSTRLRELRQVGTGLALDDFGTGYSSLAYLRRFAVDIVKLDRSFVEGLAEDPRAEALLQGVIALSRRLGLTTVAEGIEHPEDLERLRTIGCESGQGNALSAPMPAEEIPGFLSSWPGG
ncbi:MAG: EAL domain-containing protein [Nitriliruptorales bacterium]|nr:EAL domain-containing protein [Nitriliruptorales bacterium]